MVYGSLSWLAYGKVRDEHRSPILRSISLFSGGLFDGVSFRLCVSPNRNLARLFACCRSTVFTENGVTTSETAIDYPQLSTQIAQAVKEIAVLVISVLDGVRIANGVPIFTDFSVVRRKGDAVIYCGYHTPHYYYCTATQIALRN